MGWTGAGSLGINEVGNLNSRCCVPWVVTTGSYLCQILRVGQAMMGLLSQLKTPGYGQSYM